MTTLPPLPDPSHSPIDTSASSRPSWMRWALIGGSLLAVLGVACCAIAVFGGFRVVQGLQAQSDQIKPVVSAFLAAGQQGDTDAALKLFADDTTASRESIDRLFGERPEIFQDYSDVTITGINVNSGTSGTTARIEGKVTYPAAPERGYSAALRKVGETWQLVSIQFTDGV